MKRKEAIMSWYQPNDLELDIAGAQGEIQPGFKEKLKLFLWNRVLPAWARIRLSGSRFDHWVDRG